jgi:hypothetical protein
VVMLLFADVSVVLLPLHNGICYMAFFFYYFSIGI